MRSILLLLVMSVLGACSSGQDWRTASRESAGDRKSVV